MDSKERLRCPPFLPSKNKRSVCARLNCPVYILAQMDEADSNEGWVHLVANCALETMRKRHS